MSQEEPSDEELRGRTLLGEDAKSFLEGDLGKALIALALQKVGEGQKELETVNPTDTPAIERIQNDIKTARNFGRWLRLLVEEGESALTLYRQRHHVETN